MTILAKLLKRQELGYSGDLPDQRGAYFLISNDWRRYFPTLTSTQLNDTAPIQITFEETGPVVVPYVWHNSKVVNNQANGRDETRIYISALKAKGLKPSPEDIVTFKVANEGEHKLNIVVGRLIQRASSEHHEVLQDRGPGSNYWIMHRTMSSNLREVDSDSPTVTSEHLIAQDMNSPTALNETLPVVDPSLGRFLSQSPDEVMASRINQAMFRAIVLSAYDEKCAIDRSSIIWERLSNIEAAHIRPSSHGGPNLPSNGIALSRDLHWAFDKGMFTIDSSCRVEVHPRLLDRGLKRVHGIQLPIPTEPFYAPREDYINYHRNVVFGLFLTQGTLYRASADPSP